MDTFRCRAAGGGGADYLADGMGVDDVSWKDKVIGMPLDTCVSTGITALSHAHAHPRIASKGIVGQGRDGISMSTANGGGREMGKG